MQRIIYLFCLLMFIGCAMEGIQIKTADDVFNHSKIDFDAYSKTTSLKGPVMPWINVDNGFVDYLLMTFAKDDYYYLLIKYNNSNWGFIDSAYDINNEKLDVVKLGSEVQNDGWIEERITVKFKRDYLEKNLKSGLSIKFYGKKTFILSIPDFYIQGFIKKIDDSKYWLQR